MNDIAVGEGAAGHGGGIDGEQHAFLGQGLNPKEDASRGIVGDEEALGCRVNLVQAFRREPSTCDAAK